MRPGEDRIAASTQRVLAARGNVQRQWLLMNNTSRNLGYNVRIDAKQVRVFALDHNVTEAVIAAW